MGMEVKEIITILPSEPVEDSDRSCEIPSEYLDEVIESFEKQLKVEEDDEVKRELEMAIEELKVRQKETEENSEAELSGGSDWA